MSAIAAIAPVTMRSLEPDDQGFIYSSWLKSYRLNSPEARSIPRVIYFQRHKALIAATLARSDVVIAASPEDRGQILGYGVFQPSTAGVPIVHFVYVKQPFRLFRVGTQIIAAIRATCGAEPDAPFAATHMTTVGAKTKWNMAYNPYLRGGEG